MSKIKTVGVARRGIMWAEIAIVIKEELGYCRVLLYGCSQLA